MLKKLRLMLKTLQQLGWTELWPYLRYRMQLASGWLRLKTRPVSYEKAAEGAGDLSFPLFPAPEANAYRRLLASDAKALLAEADQIVDRQARLFGGKLFPLQLQPEGPLQHWTRHTASQHHGEDIKLIWEPARFGWAVTLARAYLFSADERYPAAFWSFTDEFLQANPPNIGPNWASGQEVALRLMTLAFSAGVMAGSQHTTPARLDLLRGVIASHADRITATLDYARAQNNNHLISEAAGLYTAAALLPDHSRAEYWRETGWRWLHHALQTQIRSDGSYVQHSTNYLRLVLQIALFINRIAESAGQSFPEETSQRLAAAANWLGVLIDPESGGVPNLGGNDGAYFFPLTNDSFSDFRPVLQAARQAFLAQVFKTPEEMSLWLAGEVVASPVEPIAPGVLRLAAVDSWAYLRAARFEHRPAHADQLHLDLWWRGINFAADPGVVHYNADPPWDNPLDTSAYHNTLTINGQPQMTKAGRFLWLDWAQAEVLDTNRDQHGLLSWAVVQHDGYRRVKLIHRRAVSVQGDLWMVRDQVLPIEDRQDSREPVEVRLHWLLPDLEWEFNNGVLRLTTQSGDVSLRFRCQEGESRYSLVRAGEELLRDALADPVRGWFSPTYAEKVPALSLAVTVQAVPPLTITTNWDFPD